VDSTAIKDAATIVGALIALLTLGKGVLEYAKNNAMKRAEYFWRLHQQLNDVVVLNKIRMYLDSNSKQLKKLTYSEKYQFLSFFENVALMVNTGLLRKSVAQYMFSYYAIRCYENTMFWSGHPKKDSPYWSLFSSFAVEMKTREEKMKREKSGLKRLRF
jgi:hypothetical protein